MINIEKLSLFICVTLIAFSCHEKESVSNRKDSSGKKIGLWVYVTNEGDTISKEIYNNYSVLEKEIKYVLNKKSIETSYQNGKIKEVVRFYENGNIKSITTYNERSKSKKITYFKNGLEESISHFVENRKYPTKFFQYYENGNIEFKTDFFGEGPALFYDTLGRESVKVQYHNFQIIDTLEVF